MHHARRAGRGACTRALNLVTSRCDTADPPAARIGREAQTNTGVTHFLHLGRSDRAVARAEKRRQEAAQVTFADLTWDHFHWEQRRLTGSTENLESASRYRDTRAAFEARHGEITGEYWSITKPSGVALTRKRAPLLLRPLVDDTRRFHRATDWVTRDAPALADVLFACETLAIRVTEVLRFTSESVALRRIVAVASHLLGSVDRAEGKLEAAKARQIADDQTAELKDIEDYYTRAGVKIGRMVYTQGMIIGLLLVAGLGTLIVVLFAGFDVGAWNDSRKAFLVSYGAGAVGAFVSVLQRMASEKFTVHYDLGKRNLYMLGSYRPVLGAVFGVFTYFVLASQLLKTEPPTRTQAFYYYGALAFVAGFSERFTRIMIKGASAGGSPH